MSGECFLPKNDFQKVGREIVGVPPIFTFAFGMSFTHEFLFYGCKIAEIIQAQFQKKL